MKQESTVSQPASDYASALAQFAALQALDDDPCVNPDCRSQLLSHGRMTERVIVLMHGMTNCPCQFRKLAPLFYERGYNVLSPRQPREGFTDLDTTALSGLTLSELRNSAHRAIDIARGLGQQVTVVGISAGGTLAAWLAQQRADVHAAVLIAPFFGALPRLPILNMAANVALIRLLQVAPNIMTQWIKPFTEGPPQGYHGFASRGLATAMRLGLEVYRDARVAAPAAGSILMMLNPVDPAVNNEMSLDVLNRWRKRSDRVELYYFDAKRHLIHDIIDPAQPQQQVDYTYPILIEQSTRL